jgi:hypothetical protein
VDLTFRELELNADLPADAFELRTPEGTREIRLGDGSEDEDLFRADR